MADVFLNVFGNGYATTDALPPMVEGETFTITFYPDPGETLEDVRAFDSHDYPVALPSIVGNVLTMTWRSDWGNLYVDIYFSGGPTPPPPTPTLLPWMIAILSRRQHKRIHKNI